MPRGPHTSPAYAQHIKRAALSWQADHLRKNAGSEPSKGPAPEPDAELLPEIETYLKEHQLKEVLATLVTEKVKELPADAVPAMADWLEGAKLQMFLKEVPATYTTVAQVRKTFREALRRSPANREIYKRVSFAGPYDDHPM